MAFAATGFFSAGFHLARGAAVLSAYGRSNRFHRPSPGPLPFPFARVDISGSNPQVVPQPATLLLVRHRIGRQWRAVG